MYLIGWCRVCRKVKRVRVTVPPVKGVAIGVCRDCEGGQR